MSLHSTSRVRVRYAETDQMGVAWHGHYLAWFEVGRTDLLRTQGVTYRELEEGGLRLPVIDARLSFVRPALYDDLGLVGDGVEFGLQRLRPRRHLRQRQRGRKHLDENEVHCA